MSIVLLICISPMVLCKGKRIYNAPFVFWHNESFNMITASCTTAITASGSLSIALAITLTLPLT